MVKEYLEKLIELINKIYPTKPKNIEISTKHFFSGAAVYANGKICITLTPVGLAIKLPEQQLIKLIREKTAKPLRYFPNGPIKKDYAVFPESKIKNLLFLKNLVEISVNYVTNYVKLISSF